MADHVRLCQYDCRGYQFDTTLWEMLKWEAKNDPVLAPHHRQVEELMLETLRPDGGDTGLRVSNWKQTLLSTLVLDTLLDVIQEPQLLTCA